MRRTGRRMLAGAVLSAAVVVSVQPTRFGLSTRRYALHVLSFRGPAALALAAAGVVLLSARRGPFAGFRRAVGAAVLSSAVGNGVVVARRGWNRPGRPDRADLVVLTLNTLGGAATAEQIADLIIEELRTADAAVVSLPETPASQAHRCADLLAAHGRTFQVFSTTEGTRDFDTTSLLVDRRLGAYEQHPAPLMLHGAVLARPSGQAGPVFGAVHPGAPVIDVGYAHWERYVTSAVEMSRSNPDSVVAGDFNATIDHRMLADLAPSFDAAVAAGRGAEGTWPASVPGPFAAPIDHVLLHGAYSVLGTRTVVVGESDHRAVVARLIRTNP